MQIGVSAKVQRSINFTPCSFFIYKILQNYLFLSVLGLRCCVGFSLAVESGGYTLVAVQRHLIVEHRLQSDQASVLVARGLSSCGSV